MDDMMNDEIVLCAASAYEEKFYLNPEFDQLPESARSCRSCACCTRWTWAAS